MTPEEVLRLSEPVEQLYMNCSSQLLINLCRHFKTGKSLPSREWEIKKLGELGQLTNESIEIIAFNTGQKTEAIKQAIAETLVKEVTPIEKTLQQAAKKGVIQGANIVLGAPESTQNVLANQSIITVLQNLTQQANEETNIVNTVMLDSVRNRYVQAINNTLVEEQREIERLQSAQDLATLNAQLEKTQTALNTSAFSVASGAEARTTALRRTIGQLAAEGITGYVDAGGHHWSPEAYINMDIRTTVHNAAIQGQKARSADYGVDTFQVSTHSGARPLCAPYQGKFYSWGGDSGTVYDIDGNAYKYESITTTSYGEAAGLFGINCGHFPQTFISGFSKPRFEPMEDEEENDRIYQESQEQRAIERDIRKWKTEALSYQAAGDQEGFEKAALKVKEKQADYRSFCKDTGRTPRNDRTQVFGYDRSTARKAAGAAKGYTPTPKTFTQAPTPPVQTFKPLNITNRQEAIDALVNDVGFTKAFNLDAKRITEQALIDNTQQLWKLESKFNAIHDASVTISVDGKVVRGDTLAEVRRKGYNAKLEELMFNPAYYRAGNNMVAIEEASIKSGWHMPIGKGVDPAIYTATHEYGHLLENVIIQNELNQRQGGFWGFGVNDPLEPRANEIKNEIIAIAKADNKDFSLTDSLSRYGKSNSQEFFAEVFANSQLGAPNDLGKALIKWLENRK